MGFFSFGSKRDKNKQVDDETVDDVTLRETSLKSSKSPRSLFEKLAKTSSKLNDGLKHVFVHRKLDEETLQDLEDVLIMSDMGMSASSGIITHLSSNKYNKDIDVDEIKTIISDYITNILEPLTIPLDIGSDQLPHIIVMCGVNGTGKTTTIGKLASHYKAHGKKVMLAACDTFRAAAVDQLAVWSERADVPLIQGDLNSDPASVAYKAYVAAKAEGIDVLLVDTAGRLQNKKDLMEQLAKIVRVIKKQDETAPHDTVLVLDATTGQNATSQVKSFKEMVDVSGLIVTKLDGTAKGGIVVSLAKEFALPIHAIGVGESIEDLRPFDAKDFAHSLVGLA